jgi:hypothetical protein
MNKCRGVFRERQHLRVGNNSSRGGERGISEDNMLIEFGVVLAERLLEMG